MSIGLPLSYWILSSFWLSGFAYKTEIGYTPFLIAASACISIALGATGYQVLKASRVNPFETLRSE
jgi:putative ABC transport system permease protein